MCTSSLLPDPTHSAGFAETFSSSQLCPFFTFSPCTDQNPTTCTILVSHNFTQNIEQTERGVPPDRKGHRFCTEFQSRSIPRFHVPDFNTPKISKIVAKTHARPIYTMHSSKCTKISTKIPERFQRFH